MDQKGDKVKDTSNKKKRSIDKGKFRSQLDSIRREDKKIKKSAKDDVRRKDMISDLKKKGVKPPKIADASTKKKLDDFEKKTNPKGYERRKIGG